VGKRIEEEGKVKHFTRRGSVGNMMMGFSEFLTFVYSYFGRGIRNPIGVINW